MIYTTMFIYASIMYAIGKMVGDPWDGTLNNQSHVQIYTLFSGNSLGVTPFQGLLGG